MDRAPKIPLAAFLRCGFLILAACTGACSRLSSHAPSPPELAPIQKASEEILVTAWAEPSRLPSGGGASQILVRVRKKKGGGPLSGVEVRFQTSEGILYSQGKVLVTDTRGMTRDRVTTRKPALVTLNAGGTPYTLRVNVGEPQEAN
jgi:hypothetical protein